MPVYDYIDQEIQSTALIRPLDSDSFYNPVTQAHTGFAADGTRYSAGVQDFGPVYASWYLEFNPSPNSVEVALANVQIASNVLTVNTFIPNNFIPGQTVYFRNVQNATFLNNQLFSVQSSSGTQFSGAFIYANYPQTNDSGTVGPSPYRGEQQSFPHSGLILLSQVALTILDQSTPGLPLWMQFILGDSFAFANNFNGLLAGWTPSGLQYADGIISVVYKPDVGSQVWTLGINSNMIVSVDFAQDQVSLDVGVAA